MLCTVNAANAAHPLEVYRFFRDELGAHYIQFIPIVEVATPPTGDRAGHRSPTAACEPEEYGRFLIAIFDEWVRRDVGEMFVQFFDGVLAAYLRGVLEPVRLRPTCGEGVALEHNGDLYSCDHFVEPDAPARQHHGDARRRAGRARSGSAPSGRPSRTPCPPSAARATYLFACNGECPKNRILLTPDGEPGLNWLCAGLKAFFAHIERPMRLMAEILRARRRGARDHAAASPPRPAQPGATTPAPAAAARSSSAAAALWRPDGVG